MATNPNNTTRSGLTSAQVRRALVNRDERIIRRFKLRQQNGQLKSTNVVQIQKLLAWRKAAASAR